MATDNAIANKTYAFALRIIKAEKYLRETHQEWVLSKQLLRCGTSIGANCRESKNAQSTADFISKFSIALKEADETDYWLNLLKDSGYIEQNVFESMISDLDEIGKLLTSIIKTNKKKFETENKKKNNPSKDNTETEDPTSPPSNP